MLGDLKLNTNEKLARDNVCEMVFNAMTKAVPVHYSERWDVYYTDNQSILNGVNYRYIDTLAYQNFDLVYDEGKEDAFGRPSTEWGIGNLKNGEKSLDDKGYIVDGQANIKTSIIKAAEEASVTYTKEVKVGDIYKDLGLTDTVLKEDVTVYVDGVDDASQPAYNIKKSDTTHKYGGNGVLTQVFYFPGSRTEEDSKIVITEINTWTGEISKSVAATDKKDAYVVIITESELPAGVSGNLEFETDASFEDEARVIYTYSRDTEEVQSVAVAELVSGETDRVENKETNGVENKAIYIDGTGYKFSAKSVGENGITVSDVSVGNGYDVYLDAYGYVIYLAEIEEIGDYALVLNAQDKTNFASNQALLVFADGTEKVVDTDKNYKAGSGKNAIEPGTIVTFREIDGVYTLKPVSLTISNEIIDAGAPKYTGGSGVATQFELVNDRAGVKLHTTADGDYYQYKDPDAPGAPDTAKTTATTDDTLSTSAGLTVTANSNTTFVVYNDTDDEYNVYTGIKNVPTIKATADPKPVVAFTYCKNGTMANVMFIFVRDGSIIEDEGKDTIFLAKESVSNLIHDKTGDYFIYNAVVDDEITTVKVDESLGKTLNGPYKSYAMDKNGIITRVTAYTPYDGDDSGKEALTDGIGIAKRSGNYTVILDTQSNNATPAVNNKVVTVDKTDEHIYMVDTDGKITEGSYRSISEDDKAKVYAVIDDALVKYLFIESTDDPDKAEMPGSLGVTATVNDATETSPVSAEVGDKVILTANATVSKGTLSYQWYKSSANHGLSSLANVKDNTKTTKMSGETNKTLTVDTTSIDAGTSYYCVVTNSDDKKDEDNEALAGNAKVIVTAATQKMTVKTICKMGDQIIKEETEVINENDDRVDGGYITIDAPELQGLTPDKDEVKLYFINGGTGEAKFTYTAGVDSIEVTTDPSDMEVKYGEDVTLTGMVVTATLKDGTTKQLTNDEYEVDSTAVTENKKLTVKYKADSTITAQTTGETDVYFELTGVTVAGSDYALSGSFTAAKIKLSDAPKKITVDITQATADDLTDVDGLTFGVDGTDCEATLGDGTNGAAAPNLKTPGNSAGGTKAVITIEFTVGTPAAGDVSAEISVN